MKLYVTVEEFLYAKKIENQTERTLRGYKNGEQVYWGDILERSHWMVIRQSCLLTR